MCPNTPNVFESSRKTQAQITLQHLTDTIDDDRNSGDGDDDDDDDRDENDDDRDNDDDDNNLDNSVDDSTTKISRRELLRPRALGSGTNTPKNLIKLAGQKLHAVQRRHTALVL
jgi:hypothetical protein